MWNIFWLWYSSTPARHSHFSKHHSNTLSYMSLCVCVSYSVYIILHVCMYSGITIWYWIINWYLLLVKTISSPFCISQLPAVICVGLRLCGLSHVHFITPTVADLYQIIFSQSCWWDLLPLWMNNNNMVYIPYGPLFYKKIKICNSQVNG